MKVYDEHGRLLVNVTGSAPGPPGPPGSSCVQNTDDSQYYQLIPYNGDIDPVTGLPTIIGVWEPCVP